jgi:hypothetical protein
VTAEHGLARKESGKGWRTRAVGLGHRGRGRQGAVKEAKSFRGEQRGLLEDVRGAGRLRAGKGVQEPECQLVSGRRPSHAIPPAQWIPSILRCLQIPFVLTTARFDGTRKGADGPRSLGTAFREHLPAARIIRNYFLVASSATTASPGARDIGHLQPGPGFQVLGFDNEWQQALMQFIL